MEVATIVIKRIPFDGGYSFDVDYAGVPLEDHPLSEVRGLGPNDSCRDGLERIGYVLDEIEQSGP